MLIEEIEARILHSADAMTLLDPGLAGGMAQVRMLDAPAAAPPAPAPDPPLSAARSAQEAAQRHEIVFIDPRVADARGLAADIYLQGDAKRHIEIIDLDPGQDGIAQIGRVLAERRDIAAVHLISHGADGRVALGSSVLDFDTLRDEATRIKAWGTALTEDADLLIYGCDVAATSDGQALISALARLTGADVAASTDATGAASLGGNWLLEFHSGAIEAAVAPGAAAQQDWQQLLTLTPQGSETRVNSNATGTQTSTGYGSVQDASTRQVTQRIELVFIDSRVSDQQALIDDLRARSDSATGFEVVVIDRGSDGLAQIDAALAGRSGIDALHVVSHGDDGALLLGSRTYDAAALQARADQISRWQGALSDDADILLYGCDVAQGDGGQALLTTLARLTRADVAASTDTTGAAANGGNWVLEAQTGQIEANVAFSAELQATWQPGLASYVVINTNDSGAGSLRQAITDANTNAGADIITFNIAGTGVHTIAPTAALPTITGQVMIDATTDDSFAANANQPAILIDANGLAADGFVLSSTADGSVIRGFVIRNFAGNGINIQTGSDGNTIAGNYIGGLTPGGVVAAGENNTASGILVSGANNTIGGTLPADRNVIAGNLNGVYLTGASANTNSVLNNYIGVNVTGGTALTNSGRGVYIDGGASSNVIGQAGYGNVISGFSNIGLHLVGGTSNVIQANTIGLNAAGTAAISNGAFGVAIDGGATGTLLGGTGAGQGNVISGNTGATGSVARGGVYVQATNTTIQGNV